MQTRFVSLFLVSFLLAYPLKSHSENIHGVFKVAKGDITVTTKDGKSEKAKLGLKVYPGSKIKTAKDARGKIVMIDQNEINITPDTEVVIEDYTYNPEKNKKNVLLNVMYGKIRAKVEQKYEDNNKFQVKTKSAVAGVRGTDFFTDYQPSSNQTKVVTFEGKVEFGQPGLNGEIKNAVFVGPGQVSSLSAGAGPSKPVELPKTEFSKMNNSTNTERSPASEGGFSMFKEGDFAGDSENSESRGPTACETCPPPPPPTPGEGCPPKCDGPKLDPCADGNCGGGRKLILDVTNQ